MKSTYYLSFSMILLIAHSLSARDFLKGTLAWSMERQAAQFVPDVLITQNMVGTGGFVISSPGTYALAENISFTTTTCIAITASGVTLDLNGHQITGPGAVTGSAAIRATSVSEIIVKNGLITDVDSAIVFTGVLLGVIDFIQANVSAAVDTGILIAASNQIWITNCLIRGGNDGIFINAASADVTVENCININCALRCFINAGVNTVFRLCRAIAAGSNGFQNSVALRCKILECHAEQCNVGIFNGGGSNGAIIKDCTSEGNTSHGFSNTPSDVSIIRCIALANGGNGFENTAADVTIKSCEAIDNTGVGINDGSGSANPNIFNNLSYANGTNYAGVPAATIVAASLVTTTTGVFWSNVSNP